MNPESQPNEVEERVINCEKSDNTPENTKIKTKASDSEDEESSSKILVKVYGLLGYTRYIDVPFKQGELQQGNVFSFEKRSYKIASVITLADNNYAINAVATEYGG